jgi:signal transduction histidine kinase
LGFAVRSLLVCALSSALLFMADGALQTCSEHLLAIVNDILDFSKIEVCGLSSFGLWRALTDVVVRLFAVRQAGYRVPPV